MWYLMGLILVSGAIGAFVVGAHRGKQRVRDAERELQVAALLAKLKPGTSETLTAVPVQARSVAVSEHAAPVFIRKQRLLPQRQALLYLVFRAGLPDHEIFARVRLAEVLDISPAVPPIEREQKVRKLAQRRLDLVICNKALEVVAVVLLDAGGTGSDATRFTAQCLEAAAIRLVTIDPVKLPRHGQVRALVYG